MRYAGQLGVWQAVSTLHLMAFDGKVADVKKLSSSRFSMQNLE